MDRSRRIGAKGRATTAESAAPPSPPSSSRLTLRGRKNRRRPASLWSRMPQPHAIADACGRALRRSLPAAIAACAIVGAGAAVWLGYRFVTTSPRYAITSIEVRGAHHLSADEVRAALPVALGDNVFLASTEAAVRALRRHPWIAAATAQRILPGTLVVEIREHEPVAVAVIGEPYLIGPDGHPFKRAQPGAGEEAGLPLVTGVDREAYRSDPDGTARSITAALAALARWRSGPDRPAIGEVHLDAQGTLTLRTADRGAAIELGPLDAGQPGALLDERLRTFDAVWAELRDSERERGRARTFHLDARTDHVTVAFAKD
jgi:cell division protein FtsQ